MAGLCPTPTSKATSWAQSNHWGSRELGFKTLHELKQGLSGQSNNWELAFTASIIKALVPRQGTSDFEWLVGRAPSGWCWWEGLHQCGAGAMVKHREIPWSQWLSMLELMCFRPAWLPLPSAAVCGTLLGAIAKAQPADEWKAAVTDIPSVRFPGMMARGFPYQ